MPRLVNDLYLFWGGECSNWYKSNFSLDGMSFNCVELINQNVYKYTQILYGMRRGKK